MQTRASVDREIDVVVLTAITRSSFDVAPALALSRRSVTEGILRTNFIATAFCTHTHQSINLSVTQLGGSLQWPSRQQVP